MSPSAGADGAGCVFCAIVAADDPEVLVYTGDTVVGFLDTRPLFPGHVLLVPRAHTPTLAELPTTSMAPLLTAAQVMMAALERSVGAEGTFVAANNRVSQSVPHLHLHVVPRRPKDGLKGFFWPRTGYDDDRHLAAVRSDLRAAVAAVEAAREA